MAGVNFTLPSARRIAAAVREVEFGSRDAGAGSVPRAWDVLPLRLKVGTFTGAWSTGTWKSVTLKDSTVTELVYNWTTPIVTAEGDENCFRHVVFGRASGTQSALEIQLQTTCSTCFMMLGGVDLSIIKGFKKNEVQILGHNTTPCLEWYSITTCSTATAS